MSMGWLPLAENLHSRHASSNNAQRLIVNLSDCKMYRVVSNRRCYTSKQKSKAL